MPYVWDADFGPHAVSGGWTALSVTARWVADTGGTGQQQQQPSTSVVTGINPQEIASVLYGKPIPLCAFGDDTAGGGLARIGTAGLIFGPYISGGAASFAVSFGYPANPSGTRRVYEIALDGKVAWELAAGSAAGSIDAAGFVSEAFTCRFYQGTLTQTADPLEVTHFGSEAIAYRPQMMLWFENLPLAPFSGLVPFVSCKIGDVTGGATAGDGVNLGSALEAIATSPWLEYTSAEFETSGVQDIVQGMILTEDQSFLDLLQNTARFYRTLDILQTDKLRVNDRGSTVAPDLTLDRNRIVAESGVQYMRREELAVPRELEFITIDPEADYVFVPSKAARPRHPVPVTSSVGKETMTLPIIIGATTRASAVTYAKYQEENARKRVQLSSMLYGYELEPGDLVALNGLVDGLDNNETYKIIEASHGANYVTEMTLEAMLKCDFPSNDPYINYVVLLVGFEGSDGSTGAPGLTDESPAEQGVGVVFGAAQITTSDSKYGSGSYLGSSGSRIQYDNITGDWDLSSANSDAFTVEIWANHSTGDLTVGGALFWRALTVGTLSWVFWVNTDQSLNFHGSTTGGALDWAATSAPLTWAADQWYHLAADKDATGKVRIFRDGVMVGAVTPANSVTYASGQTLSIGSATGGTLAWTGFLDEARITKGISRYGADTSFTPPPVFGRE